MLTVAKIKAAAQNRELSFVRPGSFFLRPPVEVIEIETGNIFHVKMVDENGPTPNMVHLQESGIWCPIENFKLKG